MRLQILVFCRFLMATYIVHAVAIFRYDSSWEREVIFNHFICTEKCKQLHSIPWIQINNPIKSENMKIFHLNNSVNSWMDFFYLFADSHKYSIPDLEKIWYQPSLFCIYKKLITQRSIHRTLSRICPQWHETHPTTYIWLALTTYSGTGWC